MSNSIVYRDLLLKQRHGLPLWKPDPNANLPEEYIKNGISIGDLGILTDDGGFDYLFNIHADADDPINEFLGTPPFFSPLPLDTVKDITVTTFQHPEGACITRNASFEVKSNIAAGGAVVPSADISLAVEFAITEVNAAMLVLPHGADRYEAKAYGKYKAYVFRHAESWYEHLNHVEQREVRNGSLYLVTGCDKARSWGLAAGSPHQERTMGFNITAGSQASGTVGAIYASWRNTGGMESRHFPPSTNRITKSTNQCVFARGFVIGINESFFKRKWAGTVRTEKIASSSKSFPTISNSVPFQSPPGRSVSSATMSSLQTSQNSANSSSPHDLLYSDQDTVNTDNAETISDVTVWDTSDYPKPVLSPGSYVCQHILSSQSNIDVIVVHDNDWMTATASDTGNIFTLDGTNYKHLTDRVLEICYPATSASAAPSQQDHRLPGLSSRLQPHSSSSSLSKSSMTHGHRLSTMSSMEGLEKATKNIVAPTSIAIDPVTGSQLPDIRTRGPVQPPIKGSSNFVPSNRPYSTTIYPPPGGSPGNPAGGYAPSGYAPSGYAPSGYAPSGYAPSGYAPNGYPSNGYPPNGYPAASGGYPQPSAYPTSGGYPPSGAYPPAQGGYTPPNGYFVTGGYPAQGGNPTGRSYYPMPNNGSSYPGPSYYPSNFDGDSSGGHVQASTTTPVRDAVVIDSPPPANPQRTTRPNLYARPVPPSGMRP